MSEGREEGSSDLHPISSLCQDVDDELLMLRFPPSHLSMRINGELDIILDIISLSALVVYGNRSGS